MPRRPHPDIPKFCDKCHQPFLGLKLTTLCPSCRAQLQVEVNARIAAKKREGKFSTQATDEEKAEVYRRVAELRQQKYAALVKAGCRFEDNDA